MKEYKMTDILKLKMSKLNKINEEIETLTSVSFEKMSDAIDWIEKNDGFAYNYDESEGYVDFNYGTLSGTFSNNNDDGYWLLTDLIDVYNDDGDIVLQIELGV